MSYKRVRTVLNNVNHKRTGVTKEQSQKSGVPSNQNRTLWTINRVCVCVCVCLRQNTRKHSKSPTARRRAATEHYKTHPVPRFITYIPWFVFNSSPLCQCRVVVVVVKLFYSNSPFPTSPYEQIMPCLAHLRNNEERTTCQERGKKVKQPSFKQPSYDNCRPNTPAILPPPHHRVFSLLILPLSLPSAQHLLLQKNGTAKEQRCSGRFPFSLGK